MLASILSLALPLISALTVPVTDPHIIYSPYNWTKSGSAYAQSPNPGAYLRLVFTGTSISVNIDVSPLTEAKTPSAQYPLVRFSVDGKPAKTLQLTPTTISIPCGTELAPGNHTLLLQYVSGYVFLDFWTPVNVLRVTGFVLDAGAATEAGASLPRSALFLGDSITNGDDDVATFGGGITNAVDTQDATLGYPVVVASALDAEYGIVAYGGASWDHTAADSHTPGLPSFFPMLDSLHSRLIAGKLSPDPDDVFINMGENSGPKADDVPKLLSAVRAACSAKTNIFVIVPFSGRSRAALKSGLATYLAASPSDSRTFLLDLGNNPYVMSKGPSMMSVDGQHPLASLHAILGAQLVQVRARLLFTAKGS